MKKLIPALALALAGCAPSPDDELVWTQVPNDPQVENFVFQRCLAEAKGPTKTVYNDWAEAIQQCGRQAASQSRYCPPDRKCRPDISSRDDVRAILPTPDMEKSK